MASYVYLIDEDTEGNEIRTPFEMGELVPALEVGSTLEINFSGKIDTPVRVCKAVASCPFLHKT